jgi:hypothetical protein
MRSYFKFKEYKLQSTVPILVWIILPNIIGKRIEKRVGGGV